MSMIFQSYALWPHLTVAENVAYGLKLRRLARADIEKPGGRDPGHDAASPFCGTLAGRTSPAHWPEAAVAADGHLYR